jgi:hypothetical protein
LFREPRKNHIKKNRKVNRQRREGIPTHFCLEKLSFGVLLCGILTPLTIDIVEKEKKRERVLSSFGIIVIPIEEGFIFLYLYH